MQILTLTPNAEKKMKDFLSQNPNKIGISIALKKGGCAGFEYSFSLLDTEPLDTDKIEISGINLFIARSDLLFLIGTTIDYEITPIKAGFVFQNPNQISACGCGESVLLKPAFEK